MRASSLLAALFCASLFGQPAPTDVFGKAPPEVDQALRARVAQYYQAFVDGKFRVAEQVVADDSRDIFYEMEKQRYLGFEIASIAYSDNFTKAKVITAVEMDWRNPRIGVMRVKPPLPSTWRLENGNWSWYTVPQKDWDSPFGKMNPGPDGPSKIAPDFKHVSPDEVLSQVKISKTVATLSSYQKSKDTVELSNGLPGEISLRLESVVIPGLEIKPDKTTLKAGESAQISFNYNPDTPNPKASVVVDVHVQPTGQIIPIRLNFAIPPEVEEQLKRIQ